jgi:hypothetical protein
MPSPSLLGKVPGLPPGVDQVIQKALVKDAGQRFANVQDFAQALEIAARGGDPTGLIQYSFASSVAISPTESGPSVITGIPGQQGQLSTPSVTLANSLSPSTYASGVQQPYPPTIPASGVQQPFSPTISTSGVQQPYPQQITTPPPTFQTGQFTQPFQPQPQPVKTKGGRFYQVVILLLVILVVGVGAWGYIFVNHIAGVGNTKLTQNTQTTTQNTQTTNGQGTQPTATPTSQVTSNVTPTTLAADSTITANKLLTCSTCSGGNDPIHFTIDTITIDNANGRTVWSATLQNVSGNGYYLGNQGITLQTSSGTTPPVQATGVLLPAMNAGDKKTIQFIFAFVPYKGVQYTFSAHLSDNGGDNMPFDSVNFTF